MSNKCKIIEKEDNMNKEVHAWEEGRVLHGISMLKDNTEIISKLPKKETKTFIALIMKVQEALKKVSQSKKQQPNQKAQRLK